MRLLRRLQSPWVSAALLLVLVLDAYIVAEVSGIMFRAGLWRRAVYPANESTQFFDRTPSGLRLCTSVHAADGPLVQASITLQEFVTGLWAPTTRHYDSRLRDRVYATSPLTAPERQQLRDHFAIERFGDGTPASARCVGFLKQPENSDCRTTIASGYVHDAAALLALAAFLWSLGWIGHLTAVRRRAKLRAAGLCPFCCYELQGLKSAVCPECGKATP